MELDAACGELRWRTFAMNHNNPSPFEQAARTEDTHHLAYSLQTLKPTL
jgi:hypothetical protein